MMQSKNIQTKVAAAAEQVLAAAPTMPTMRQIEGHIEDAVLAQERGYYLPDEDDRLRDVYMRYLTVRSSLLEVIGSLEPLMNQDLEKEHELSVFAVGYCAAVMLVRSAKFVVGLAEGRSVVYKKLDEAAPLYSLPRGSFSSIYSNLTSPRRMWRFYEATKFYQEKERDIFELTDGAVVRVLAVLQAEAEFIEFSKRNYVKRRLQYRVHSVRRSNTSGYRRVVFHLFRLSGSLVAELRQPLVKRLTYGRGEKRVSKVILKEVGSALQPGDVLVTRHDDAMSNLFLPGYWPHAALYVGEDGGSGVPVLESKKDGVKFRALEETLAVDAFIVLRPRVSEAEVARAIQRAVGHAGKSYDFLFDFSHSDRLACTELVYRSYHGVEGISFSLVERSGRLCLAAEDLMDQMLGQGWFEPVMIYGVKGKRISEGAVARRVLRQSYQTMTDW